jgi:metal-responsive CopG/Arc/MetJ family transcriptional regulator
MVLTWWYNSGYTPSMKTAISIPDPIFQAAEELARQLGISRSELYTTALAEYIREHRDADITERLNQLYAEEDSSLDEVLKQIQWLSLPREDW